MWTAARTKDSCKNKGFLHEVCNNQPCFPPPAPPPLPHLAFKKALLGVLLRCSGLRISHCHSRGSGHCCPSGSVHDLGTPTCCGCSQKQTNKQKSFAETLWGVREFGGREPPISLHGPAINFSLLQTLTFGFAWLHCTSGTQTQVQ